MKKHTFTFDPLNRPEIESRLSDMIDDSVDRLIEVAGDYCSKVRLLDFVTTNDDEAVSVRMALHHLIVDYTYE